MRSLAMKFGVGGLGSIGGGLKWLKLGRKCLEGLTVGPDVPEVGEVDRVLDRSRSDRIDLKQR